MKIRNYSELSRIQSFEDRFEYLRLRGTVGRETFGFDRFINQDFYTSREWRSTRDVVIARDLGLDLGVEGYEIYDRILIHHMNPLTVEELKEGSSAIIDPEFLITTSHRTHNAIHYGDESLLPKTLVERKPGDTRLW